MLHNISVDGKVDAEPLYLSQLTVAGSAHNVVFIATEHDSVYAFDSDTGTQLWQVSLLGSGETTSDNRGCGQVSPEIGITSTPVIDRTRNAIYVVAMSKDASGNYFQRLHALNLSTGAELFSGPQTIKPNIPVQATTAPAETWCSIRNNTKSALACCKSTERFTSPGLPIATIGPTLRG